jgi:hypothetical protein
MAFKKVTTNEQVHSDDYDRFPPAGGNSHDGTINTRDNPHGRHDIKVPSDGQGAVQRKDHDKEAY